MDFHLKIDSAVEMSIAAFRTGEKSRISVFFCFSGSIYTIWIWE